MTYKLAVKDVVIVPLKFSMATPTGKQNFDFTLTCDRVPVADMNAALKNDAGQFDDGKIRNQFLQITTGWTGQTLVLNDDDTPAAFCKNAFEVMLGVPSLLGLILQSYLNESAAKTKN